MHCISIYFAKNQDTIIIDIIGDKKMTSELYLSLTLCIIISFVLLYLLQLPFRKIKNVILRIILFIVKVIVTLYLTLQLIAYSPTVVWNHEFLFGSLYLVLMSDIFKDIVSFFISLFRKEKTGKKFEMFIGIVITILFVSYNIINMQTITPKYHEINSSKLKHEYTVVFFSDLHYGSAQSAKTVDKALEEIKQLKPDALLLGGDITDENTEKEEMEYLYRKIGSLGIPTYYVYGNHDRQERGEKVGGKKYTEKQLENTITRNGIKILYDDYVEINDDLILLGREDRSHPEDRKAVKDLPAIPSDRYVVALDHTPYQNEEMIELKTDLQLSGHTHAGQFFPVMTVYKLLGLNTYGDYYIGNTHLYVSPGIAGWYLPLRSEAHCNYEVITLRPE